MINKYNVYSRVPSKTIVNFIDAMIDSETCSHIRWDEFSERPVLLNPATGNGIPMTEAHKAAIRADLEENLGLYSPAKFEDAFRILLTDSERVWHPIKSRIEALSWDGREHIIHLLPRVMKTEVSPYAMELSRLLFAGGIHRLYEPGCKFDYVVTLIGTRQGEGKSTFLRWLALDDEFFGELRTFDHQKGAESLMGKWIVEIPELAALRRSEIEEVKAFITQQRDHYRRPYDRMISDIRRSCIMAGTTNSLQFLNDSTGNRRFLPIEVHSEGSELYAHEEEIKAEIKQCWAEAFAKRDWELMKPVPNRDIRASIENKQLDAAIDDPKQSIVESYLTGREATCVLEIWHDAFGHSSFEQPDKSASNEIGRILQKAGWRRTTGTYAYIVNQRKSYQKKWVPNGAV